MGCCSLSVRVRALYSRADGGPSVRSHLPLPEGVLHPCQPSVLHVALRGEKPDGREQALRPIREKRGVHPPRSHHSFTGS